MPQTYRTVYLDPGSEEFIVSGTCNINGGRTAGKEGRYPECRRETKTRMTWIAVRGVCKRRFRWIGVNRQKETKDRVDLRRLMDIPI